MAVSAEKLRAELNAGSGDGSVSLEVLQECVDAADYLLREYAGADYLIDIPEPVSERAWLAVAVELFNQRKAPNGVLNQTFRTLEGTVAAPVRIGADPLRPAYGILQSYVVGTSFA